MKFVESKFIDEKCKVDQRSKQIQPWRKLQNEPLEKSEYKFFRCNFEEKQEKQFWNFEEKLL